MDKQVIFRNKTIFLQGFYRAVWSSSLPYDVTVCDAFKTPQYICVCTLYDGPWPLFPQGDSTDQQACPLPNTARLSLCLADHFDQARLTSSSSLIEDGYLDNLTRGGGGGRSLALLGLIGERVTFA